jgi:hypothetical protein
VNAAITTGNDQASCLVSDEFTRLDFEIADATALMNVNRDTSGLNQLAYPVQAATCPSSSGDRIQ